MKAVTFFFLLIFTAILHTASSAQSTRDKGKYEYYIFINGLENKQEVERLEALVNQRPETGYFSSDRFPVRYFMLISDYIIKKEDFESWIKSEKYVVAFFGLGAESKEDALNIFYKNNKKADKGN